MKKKLADKLKIKTVDFMSALLKAKREEDRKTELESQELIEKKNFTSIA